MRILVLGGDGMFGHQVFKTLRDSHDVGVTLHQPLFTYKQFGLFDETNAFGGIDVCSFESLVEVFSKFKPQAVINAVGFVKQRDNTRETLPNLEINALLPHRVAKLCGISGARLIHISTDCVFSGLNGMRTEADTCAANDLYGRTKYLGEVTGSSCFTIRTSIIGLELLRKRSLVEWFLAQDGVVKGFRRAIYTGFTTVELSRIVGMLLERFPNAEGLYHVSSEQIDKYSLLCLLRERFGRKIEIVPDDALVIDRSLDSSKFRREFNYMPPSWSDMVAQM
jgi:dTDP-4-dehydrorhamnose reductase